MIMELDTRSEQIAPEIASSRHRPARRWLFPALLLLLYTAQCLWFIGTQSLTFDEPIHIKAGLEAWRDHRFEYAADHPPLARLLATLPIVRDAQIAQAADSPIFQTILPSPSSVAWRTRPAIMLLGIALGALLWFAVRKRFSASAANFSLALFAFTPALMAHFSVVTTDGIITLMIFATAVQLARWNDDPSWRQTLLLGLVLGLLLLAKMSAPPFFCLALGLVLLRKKDRWDLRPWRWNWRAALMACTVAFVVLWGGYFFHVSHVTVQGGVLTASSPNREAFTRKVNFAGDIHFLLPAGEYFEAVYDTVKHNKRGHQSYFTGKIALRANPWFYPLLVVLKWPTVILILSLAGFAVLARRGMLGRFADFLCFPALLLMLAISSRIGIGERHILALYPFALVFCGALWKLYAEAARTEVTPASWSGSASVAVYLLVSCAVLNAVDTLRYAPDYLSYLNAAIPRRQAYKLVTDSNLDWGQGLISLRRYQAEHPDEIIHLAYFGSADPATYGIRSVPLAPGVPQSGTIIVSATSLTGQYLEGDPDGYKWVLQYPIRAVLDDSLYVFAVPEK